MRSRSAIDARHARRAYSANEKLANNAFCLPACRLVSSRPRCQHWRWSVNDMWQQEIGVYPVNFTGQGDEWCHHLTVALTGDSHMAARGTDGTDAVELGPPLVGPVHRKLLALPDASWISRLVPEDRDRAPAHPVLPSPR